VSAESQGRTDGVVTWQDMNTYAVYVLLAAAAAGCTAQHQRFFLTQIFNKYGDHGVITYEVRKC
jgi:hypothetical protein